MDYMLFQVRPRKPIGNFERNISNNKLRQRICLDFLMTFYESKVQKNI